MPIARKNTSQDATRDLINQMKNNLKKQSPEVEIEEPETVPAATKTFQSEKPAAAQVSLVSVEQTDKKEKYADVMNIRLSKGRRNEIKTFCTGCGVTITQYIESSFEYLSKEVAAGRLVISKGGITRVE